MTYPLIEGVELDSLPLHGNAGCIDNIKIDVEVSDLIGPEYSVTAIYLGEFDAKARAWSFNVLSDASPLHAAIMHAASKNRPTIELIRERISDCMTDDDRSALADDDTSIDEARFQWGAAIGSIRTVGGRV